MKIQLIALTSFLILSSEGCSKQRRYVYPTDERLEIQRVCLAVSTRNTKRFMVLLGKIYPLNNDGKTPVLEEIRRVLTSEGQFVALVDGPMSAAPNYKEVHDLIYSYVQKEIPNYGEIDLGDPRIRGSESLSNLIHKAFPEAKVNIETNVVSMEGPAIQVAEIAAGFFYAAFVLKPESRKLMITNLSELLAISKQSTDTQRQGRFSMPINRLLVTLNIK